MLLSSNIITDLDIILYSNSLHVYKAVTKIWTSTQARYNADIDLAL